MPEGDLVSDRNVKAADSASRRLAFRRLCLALVGSTLCVPAALAVCTSPAVQLPGTGSGTSSTATVTFSNFNAGNGKVVTIGGLTLNCSSNNNTSSASVAAFFANLSNNSAGGTPPNGCTKGGSLSGWTSGTASGNSVTFTSASVGAFTLSVSPGSGNASITASTTGVSGSIASTFGGKTVCVGSGGNWNNQEFHSGSGGGPIIDWKKGPSDPADPTKTIGAWSISGNTIIYNYNGPTFTYSIWKQTNGSYDFCNGSATMVNVPAAQVLTGQVACP